MRLIDADNLNDVLEILSDKGGRREYWEQLKSIVSSCPTIEERKKGKWKVCDILDYAQRPSGRKILRCPFCGYLSDDFKSRVDYYHKLTRFCPNCGADMRGET